MCTCQNLSHEIDPINGFPKFLRLCSLCADRILIYQPNYTLQVRNHLNPGEKQVGDSGIDTKNPNSLKIESAGQWIITTNKTSSFPKGANQKDQKEQTLSFNTQAKQAELLYTLS